MTWRWAKLLLAKQNESHEISFDPFTRDGGASNPEATHTDIALLATDIVVVVRWRFELELRHLLHLQEHVGLVKGAVFLVVVVINERVLRLETLERFPFELDAVDDARIGNRGRQGRCRRLGDGRLFQGAVLFPLSFTLRRSR
jgi:hypothetical protein